MLLDFENTQKFSREQIKNFNSPKANFLTATSPTANTNINTSANNNNNINVTTVKVNKNNTSG